MHKDSEKDRIAHIFDNLKHIINLDISYEISPKQAHDGEFRIEVSNNHIHRYFEYRTKLTDTLAKQIAPIFVVKKNENKPVVLISDYLSTTAANILREQNIEYIDAAGNTFIKDNVLHLHIQGNKPIVKPQKILAFQQEASLKCIFYFLSRPDLLLLPKKYICQQIEVTSHTLDRVIDDLGSLGFLLPIQPRGYKIVYHQKLLDRWVMAFQEILRPTLMPQRYSIATKNIESPEQLDIQSPECYWGGESAADQITHYLKPLQYTIYSRLSRQAVMRYFKILPNAKGNIELLNCFWKDDVLPTNTDYPNLVPVLLIYADLMLSGDPRNQDTARKVYEEYLNSQSEPVLNTNS